MSCEPNFTFSVDGHNLTVIEADSKETECKTVNRVQLFAGKCLPNLVGMDWF